MTRTRLAAVAGLLLLALGIAVATLPARLALRWVDARQLALSGVDGSLWRGSAARTVVMTNLGPLHLGELRWRLHPLSIFSLAPRISLESVWGGQRLSARLWRRGSRWELRDVEGSVDARLLRLLAPVELRGRVSVQLDAVTATATELLRANGRVVWQDASWQAGSSSVFLGDYLALVDTAEEGQLTARVETLAGSLQVDGQMQLSSGQYGVTLNLVSPAGMDRKLAQALSLIAEPRENGYLLRLSGKLQP